MDRLYARFIAAVAALAAMPASAAIYTVGSGAGCTHAAIQAAIDAAAASSGADEIRLSGGPYTAQALTLRIDAAHGAIALSGGYAACTSSAPTGGVRTVIGGRGSGTDPVLRISDTADATLRNLEIRDGNGGGGLVVETNAAGSASSWASLIDTRVAHNASVAGGGILLANYNPATSPQRLRLQVQGNSEIAANTGYARGGGVACVNARLDVLDTASIRENSAGAASFAGSHDGGGIHANDCALTVSSSSPMVLYYNSILSGGAGGGLYLAGARARADVYAASEGASVFISNNRATRGGGLALAAGAQARLYGSAGLIDNRADSTGGAIWLEPGGDPDSESDTRFLAQSALDDEAPEDAVGCASPEVCTQILRNRAIDGTDAAGYGAVLTIAAGSSGGARAAFRGVRMQQNDGYNLILQESSRNQVVLDGSLIADNTIRGGFGAFTVAGVNGALALSASTIAGNVFTDAGSPVFGTPVTCNVADDDIGVHLRRSIVWQPGHGLLFTLFDPPQANCFTHLIANDFGWLGAAADRVVADPAFENVGGGNYRPSASSPALDFAPANPSDLTLDAGPRVIDLPAVTNLFGAQDLGAYERTYSPLVTASVTGTGGNVFPASQSVPYGQTASLSILPFGSEWHAILPFGGTCPAGTLAGNSYTTGPITAACAVTIDFIRDTTITIASTAEPAVYGQSITFTATLAASAPTGNVVFRDGATVLGTVPLSGASASLTTSALVVGTHSITAHYAGDTDNTAATSPAFAQTVNRNASITTIASPAPIRLGQTATIIATVAPASPPGAGAPTGTVSVQVATSGGSGHCTIVLPAAGCMLMPLGAYGPLTLSASYSGDANFNASTAMQTLQVEPQFVSGSVSGLTSEGLALRLSVDGDPVQTSGASTGATTFAFTQAVPVGAAYAVNVVAHPPGLYCEVANGSGTMPANQVNDVAIACSDAPHAILSASLDDGVAYARYGQTLTYTATIANTGAAGGSGVGVAAIASAGLDTGALTWSCVASGGASCGASGTGGLSDSVNLPSSGRVTYTVRVPVLAAAAEPRVRLELRVNNGEATATDSDTLVLLRDGFDAR